MVKWKVLSEKRKLAIALLNINHFIAKNELQRRTENFYCFIFVQPDVKYK